MVGEPAGHRRLVEEVTAVYEWIESQQRREPHRAGRCNACGACCDFPAYDHRLYVTPPEMIYLAAKMNVDQLLPMPTGRCPYQQDNRCTIHEYRFAGCRIFTCRGDSSFQSDLSEAALKRLKGLCEELRIPYRYQDLPTALDDAVVPHQEP
ncbi:MAG: YkgJ family cysteine cluster protein [Phycisphaerales bacterium]